MLKNYIPENSLLIRIIAVVTVFTMFLSFAGCKDDNIVSQNGGSSETTSDNISSGDSSSDDNSESSDSPSSTDKTIVLKGEETLNNAESRDDHNEIKYNDNKVVWNQALKGYAEAAADARRNEILNTGNTEKYYKITGTKYYVSPGGDDNNDGKSPKTAIRTVDGIASFDLKPGDAVLFERDSVFRLNQPISAMSGVTYGSYGNGAKPKIYGSPKNFAQAEWKPSKYKNVWQTNYVYDTACSAVFDNGKEIGYLKPSTRKLTANTHFYQDEANGLLYLYCDKGNPAKVYKSIEIAPKMFCFLIPTGFNDVTIDNICMKYAGWGGVAYWFGNDGGKVTNCEIAYMGGTFDGTVRMGNGIGSWQGNKNMVWDHNWVYQTFDTAISPQGHGDEDCVYENISISDNLLEYNNADIEFWDDKAVWKNIRCDNNICRFTSLGWGTRADDGGYRGIEGVLYGGLADVKLSGTVSMRNTIIDCPGREIINFENNPAEISKYDIKNIQLYVKQSYRTKNLAVNAFRRKANDPSSFTAVNEAEFKTALLQFCPDATIKWYE